MATMENTRSALDHPHAQDQQGTLFSTLFGALRTWNDSRLTRKALNALSDRELDDIGLVRGDIEAVAARSR